MSGTVANNSSLTIFPYSPWEMLLNEPWIRLAGEVVNCMRVRGRGQMGIQYYPVGLIMMGKYSVLVTQ
jgi:hypothetical protein